MATRTKRFGELVELIDRLPLDERASLVEVVRQRIADDEHNRITASIRAARREYARGRCMSVTPEELMREILR